MLFAVLYTHNSRDIPIVLQMLSCSQSHDNNSHDKYWQQYATLVQHLGACYSPCDTESVYMETTVMSHCQCIVLAAYIELAIAPTPLVQSANTIHYDCMTICTAKQGAALENVLAFDAADPRLRAQLAAVFASHGIPLPSNFDTSAPGQVKLHSLALNKGCLCDYSQLVYVSKAYASTTLSTLLLPLSIAALISQYLMQ
jgi:hypothetical protein